MRAVERLHDHMSLVSFKRAFKNVRVHPFMFMLMLLIFIFPEYVKQELSEVPYGTFTRVCILQES